MRPSGRCPIEVACVVIGLCLIIWAIDKMINGKNDKHDGI